MSKEELQQRLRERNALYERVFRGEEVLCPVCQKGHLHTRGKSYIFCDVPDCPMKVSIDYIRD